jgi:hypothetical protein
MRYEIDLENATPGTVIERSDCEKIVGVKKIEDAYGFQFALMQLGEFIQRELWNSGRHWTVTTSDGSVQILTHEDASRYNANHFELAIKKLRRCNRRLNAVDVGELTQDARQDHERSIIRQSRILSMLKTVRREIPTEPYKDSRPKFVIGKKT